MDHKSTLEYYNAFALEANKPKNFGHTVQYSAADHYLNKMIEKEKERKAASGKRGGRKRRGGRTLRRGRRTLRTSRRGRM
jgi:hypothetical protein